MRRMTACNNAPIVTANDENGMIALIKPFVRRVAITPVDQAFHTLLFLETVGQQIVEKLFINERGAYESNCRSFI